VFPGSILGWFLYGNAGLQPQITPDFIVSTNHVYAFMALSILGYISYKNQKLNFLFIYLFLISVFLEILHIIIPNRGFEFTDLFGNILGVLIVYFFHHIYNYFYNSKNDKKKF
jgi:glycopeptide antibiotics resistance protein